MSSGPPKPASSPAGRIGLDILTYSYTTCDHLAQHLQNSACSSLEYPPRSLRYHHHDCRNLKPCALGTLPHVLPTPYPDMFAIVEPCDPPQSLSVDAAFEHDSPGNGEKAVRDGHSTIPETCRPPASEIPTTNGAIVWFFPEDPTSLVMPQASSEDIGVEPAMAESSPRPHHSSFSAGAPTTTSPPHPSALEATPGEGVPCPCDLTAVILLTSDAIAQPLRR